MQKCKNSLWLQTFYTGEQTCTQSYSGMRLVKSNCSVYHALTHTKDMCVLFRTRIQNKFNGMVIAVFIELDTLFYKYEAVSGIPRKISPVA